MAGTDFVVLKKKKNKANKKRGKGSWVHAQLEAVPHQVCVL